MHLWFSIPVALFALATVLVCLGDFHRQGMARVRKASQPRKHVRVTACRRNCHRHNHVNPKVWE